MPTGADAIRRRRATVNGVLAILKAALNHAFKDGKTDADSAWRAVKPFREVKPLAFGISQLTNVGA